MDQDGTQKDQLLKELQERLSSGCINFGEKGSDEFYEMIAMEDEALLDHYLESGYITESKIREMITDLEQMRLHRQLYLYSLESSLRMS